MTPAGHSSQMSVQDHIFNPWAGTSMMIPLWHGNIRAPQRACNFQKELLVSKVRHPNLPYLSENSRGTPHLPPSTRTEVPQVFRHTRGEAARRAAFGYVLHMWECSEAIDLDPAMCYHQTTKSTPFRLRLCAPRRGHCGSWSLFTTLFNSCVVPHSCRDTFAAPSSWRWRPRLALTHPQLFVMEALYYDGLCL